MKIIDLYESSIIDLPRGGCIWNNIRPSLLKTILSREDIQKYGLRGVYDNGLAVASAYYIHHHDIMHYTAMNSYNFISIGKNKNMLKDMDHGNSIIFKLIKHDWLLEVSHVDPNTHEGGTPKIVGPMKLIYVNRRMTTSNAFAEFNTGMMFE